MINILLIMHRKPIAEALMCKLTDSPDINLIYEDNYHKASMTIHKYIAKVCLIEVWETGKYDTEYCLALAKEIRRKNPDCKLIIMCSERDEDSISLVVKAKRENKIDDFVFYDVTIDYLASKLKYM